MKKCHYCAEEIQEEAMKCKHCGEWLNRESPKPKEQIYSQSTGIIKKICESIQNPPLRLEEISKNKFFLYILLIPIGILLADFFLGIAGYKLFNEISIGQALIIAYLYYICIGIILAGLLYKLRKLLKLSIVAIVILFILRLILVSVFKGQEYISSIMWNTSKETLSIFGCFFIVCVIFRLTEFRFKFAEITNIKKENKDLVTGKKYDTGVCGNCGNLIKIAQERFINFLGKSQKDFCENCGILLRNNPVQSIASGFAAAVLSLIFLIGFAMNMNENNSSSSSTQSIFFLFMLLGIYEGIKQIFSGIKGIIESKKFK